MVTDSDAAAMRLPSWSRKYWPETLDGWWILSGLSTTARAEVDIEIRAEIAPEITVDEFVEALKKNFELAGITPGKTSRSGQRASDGHAAGVESSGYIEKYEFAALDVAPEPGTGLTAAADQAVSNRPTGNENDNTWLYGQPEQGFTLQLFSIRDQVRARELFQDLNGSGQFFSTVSKGTRWYFILLGSFPDKTTAQAALGDLPRWAKQAVPRRIGTLQRKRCEKRGVLSVAESNGMETYCRA